MALFEPTPPSSLRMPAHPVSMGKPDPSIPREPVHQLDLAVPGSEAEIPPVSRQVRQFLTQNGRNEDTIYALETVIEEIMTNAVKYAFSPDQVHHFHLNIHTSAAATELLIEDNGRPFDPTQVAPPKIDRALEEMPVGGLGIHLVRAFTSKIAYQRRNGKNCLRVWVQNTSPSARP